MVKTPSLLVSVIAVVGVVAAGCTDEVSGSATAVDVPVTTTQAPPTEGGGAVCRARIGFLGALSGQFAAVAMPALNGAKLAVEKFRKRKPDCAVDLVMLDTQGDAAKAVPMATRIVPDRDVVGVIGGAFSGESKAIMPILASSGVPMISPSATATELTASGRVPVFHRVLASDEAQAAAAGRYLKDVARAAKVFVVNDSGQYGTALADKVKSVVGPALVGTDTVQQGQRGFPGTIAKITATAPDAVFFAGIYTEAGPLLRELRAASSTAKFVAGDGVYDAQFATLAGPAAQGAVITCSCAPAERTKGVFADEYLSRYGTPAGMFAAEGFDAATVFLDAIESGRRNREDVLRFVKTYDKPGVARHLKFDGDGDLDPSVTTVWTYLVTAGRFVPDQEVRP
ncbi:amino acid/amide ABC transporter substrate-binding protein (HAAT family) [Herbihabitans rhizosphaerae]|uniref:Amino acid/amide ABC transporter substrate-binding protein (HAAT family) n=1 Tax=Herbihabitans rhizosphaerae TaxID=1872711 RepID=A0A4Q7L5Z7_9PSEU|nr:branched-chain amino acid ABC transporter substrate-binding protein [Herbihabitans rhizosphaerae]RZS45089.1 amino acid/amide ABC transporter substrate-binding protein (HAAT family) [Herbihabitans rhizosphaerae]